MNLIKTSVNKTLYFMQFVESVYFIFYIAKHFYTCCLYKCCLYFVVIYLRLPFTHKLSIYAHIDCFLTNTCN